MLETTAILKQVVTDNNESLTFQLLYVYAKCYSKILSLYTEGKFERPKAIEELPINNKSHELHKLYLSNADSVSDIYVMKVCKYNDVDLILKLLPIASENVKKAIMLYLHKVSPSDCPDCDIEALKDEAAACETKEAEAIIQRYVDQYDYKSLLKYCANYEGYRTDIRIISDPHNIPHTVFVALKELFDVVIS